MNRLRFLVALVVSLAFLLGWLGSAPAAPLDDLIAAAKKEGAIEFYAPTTLGPEGAQVLGDAFNNKILGF